MKITDGEINKCKTALTVLYAGETVFQHSQVLGTGTRNFWRMHVDLRRGQTKMGTMPVHRLAMVLAIRLAVGVIHVNHHWIVNLKDKKYC